MERCIQLARLAAGSVAPNPMVGAVLVHEGRIIGEGYHKIFGESHAEVNCINSVNSEDRDLIAKSVLYVSLEPCNHFGKTPPCTDLIIQHKIQKVIIGCADPFAEADLPSGRQVVKGVEKLKSAGVEVITGFLEEKCRELNKRFFTFHERKRPYIILKWAQSLNGKIGSGTSNRIAISNPYTNRQVHKWRSEEAGILIGTNTALFDDPLLTNRLWEGNNPVRLIIDSNLRLPASLIVFNRKVKTVIFNFIRHDESENLVYYKLSGNLIPSLIDALHNLNIQSIIVEGGAELLQSFIDLDLWDEARVISNLQLTIGEGVAAPKLRNEVFGNQKSNTGNLITYYTNALMP